MDSSTYQLLDTGIKWLTSAFGLAATLVGIFFTIKKFGLEKSKLVFEREKYLREQWKEKQHVYLSARRVAAAITFGNFNDSEEDLEIWNDFIDSYYAAKSLFGDEVINYLGTFYWKIDEYKTAGDANKKKAARDWFDEQIGKIEVGSKGMGPLDDIFRPYMGIKVLDKK